MQYAGNPVAALREVGRIAKRVSSVVVVTEAYAKAIAPFRKPNGSYRATAWFHYLLARR